MPPKRKVAAKDAEPDGTNKPKQPPAKSVGTRGKSSANSGGTRPRGAASKPAAADGNKGVPAGRRGRSAGQPVVVEPPTPAVLRPEPMEPTADSEDEQDQDGGMDVDSDADVAEPVPNTAAAPVPSAPQLPTTIASSYAQWSAPSAHAPPSGISVVDKTATFLKRKSDALQDPTSKRHANLVQGLRQYYAEQQGHLPVGQQGPTLGNVQPRPAQSSRQPFAAIPPNLHARSSSDSVHILLPNPPSYPTNPTTNFASDSPFDFNAASFPSFNPHTFVDFPPVHTPTPEFSSRTTALASTPAFPHAANSTPGVVPPAPVSTPVPTTTLAHTSDPACTTSGSAARAAAPTGPITRASTSLAAEQTPTSTPTPPLTAPPSDSTSSAARQPGIVAGVTGPPAKLGEFTPSTRLSIEQACARLQARLFLINAFPDPVDITRFARDAWHDVMTQNEHNQISLSHAVEAYLIKQQFTLRSRYKAAIVAKVKELYGLTTIAGDALDNRICQLKDGDVFIYESTIPRTARKEKDVDAHTPQPAGTADEDSDGALEENASKKKKFVELRGKSRAFTHPAILAVVKIVGFERKARNKNPHFAALLRQPFEDGIPFPLYAFVCTLIIHALDSVVADPDLSAATYKPIYKYWLETVTALFNPADRKKRRKMEELREQHWNDICKSYRIGSVVVTDRSRHDEALGTSDEED